MKLTYEDYCRIPEDGLRHEILDGEHVVTPAPNISHQSVLGELFAQLRVAIQKSGRGRVFLAPTDLRLSRVDVLQPDLMVILAEHSEIISEANVTGTPDLVVEILSPSTEKRDRGKKGARYAVAGVPEYWIVDAKKRVIEQHVLEGGAYRLAERCRKALNPAIIPDVRIDVTQLW